MTKKGLDNIPSGPTLDALTAEKVFGWKKVHKHQGSLVGRKQDKAGHGDELKCQTIQLIRFTRIRSRTG